MTQRSGSRRFFAAALLTALASLAATGPARAGLLYSGSSGNLSASALFQLSGTTLTVTLTNTSTHDVQVPTDVLTGLFFNTTHTLTPSSASLNGSTVFYGSLTNVGDGWGYGTGLNAQGKNSAISATGAVNGLGMSNFSGTTTNLDGLAYGILSAGDNSATGNGGVTGHGPLIKNSVKFTLTVGPGFTLDELGQSVVFQYGTGLSDTHYTSGPPTVVPDIVVVPAPPSAVLFAVGASLSGLAGWSRRRRLRAA
jgi:hypothetical protein